jgi:hypothetical protein
MSEVSQAFKDLTAPAPVESFGDENKIVSSILLMCLIVLYAMSTVTALYCAYYHLNVFQDLLGEIGGTMVAIVVMCGVEYIKIKFMGIALQMLLTKTAGATFLHLGAFFLCGLIGGGAFSFSWEVSSNGVREIMAIQKHGMQDTSRITSPRIEFLRNEAVKLDSQINRASAMVSGGLDVKYKGRTTQKGQDLSLNGSRLIDSANAAKSRIMDEIRQLESKITMMADSKILKIAQGVGAYGRWFEFLAMMALIGIAITRTIRLNKENESKKAAMQPQTIVPPPPTRTPPVETTSPRSPRADFTNFNMLPVERQWELVLSRPTSNEYSGRQLHKACMSLVTGLWIDAEAIAPSFEDVQPEVANAATLTLPEIEIELMPNGHVRYVKADGTTEVLTKAVLKSRIKSYRSRNSVTEVSILYMRLWEKLGFNESDLDKRD